MSEETMNYLVELHQHWPELLLSVKGTIQKMGVEIKLEIEHDEGYSLVCKPFDVDEFISLYPTITVRTR